MCKNAKKWDFDQYDWLQSYDDRMRKTKRLYYDGTLSRVVDKASVKEGDLVLDIGTGTGNLAARFLARGCKVIGIDPSARLLQMTKDKVTEWKGHFQTLRCEDSFLSIPFGEQTFDVVASTFSIHHISDDEKRLSVKEMKRVLRPGGRVVIGDVMFKDTADKIRALTKYPDMDDEYQPTLDTFPIMFEDGGFIVEVEQLADTVYLLCALLRV